jgi:hypothetical protein
MFEVIIAALVIAGIPMFLLVDKIQSLSAECYRLRSDLINQPKLKNELWDSVYDRNKLYIIHCNSLDKIQELTKDRDEARQLAEHYRNAYKTEATKYVRK